MKPDLEMIMQAVLKINCWYHSLCCLIFNEQRVAASFKVFIDGMKICSFLFFYFKLIAQLLLVQIIEDILQELF